MANLRHATRRKTHQTSYLAYLIAAGQKLSRLQTIALGSLACLLTLGFAQAFSGESGSTASQQLTTNPIALEQMPSSNRKTIKLALNGTSVLTPPATNNTAQAGSQNTAQRVALPAKASNTATHTAVKPAAQAAISKQQRKVKRTIKSGDNLSEVFSSVGLSQRDVYDITSSGKQGKALTKMFPGESLTFIFNHDKTLNKIIRDKSALEAIHFSAKNGHYKSQIHTRTANIKRVHKSGTVAHSLSRAAEKSGLSQSTTMNMANIFGGVMDFALDVRSGDRFTVIYEEHFLDGKKIKDGHIVAAQYINRSTQHNAFRYEHSNGDIGYYNEDGISLRKAFLRAPLDFTRVSSSFNLKRLHPITKKVKPHRGIDYAATRGTPIFSVGEGRVIASGYSSANGKYVFIKHGEAYTTKYLHLHKRTVKKGQRVKQGQIIGQVGCTGLCTGPHLHYEFLVNGVHRNPRTIVKKLPKAKRLAKNQLPAFSIATADTQDILRYHSAQFEIASSQWAAYLSDSCLAPVSTRLMPL